MEIEPDSVIFRIAATPLRSEDGSQLADEGARGIRAATTPPNSETAGHDAALPD